MDRLIDSNQAWDWAATENLKQMWKKSDTWWKFTTAMQLAATRNQGQSQAAEGGTAEASGGEPTESSTARDIIATQQARSKGTNQSAECLHQAESSPSDDLPLTPRQKHSIEFLDREHRRQKIDARISEDYRNVTVDANTYTLTKRQADFIQFLDREHQGGSEDVSIDRIMLELGAEHSRWQDTWKSNLEARKALMESGQRKGTLRLRVRHT